VTAPPLWLGISARGWFINSDTPHSHLQPVHDWCAAHDDIPELLSLATTISRWEDELVCAVLTGVTNATSEALNRLAKLEARQAYGFRNPASQRRRVRTACTRGTRRSRSATNQRSRLVSRSLRVAQVSPPTTRK
jgi:hypothetical protein